MRKAFKLSACLTLASVLTLALVLTTDDLLAGQSTIVEVDSYACLGDDKSRRQTEQEALSQVKRKAAEQVLTYIKSETKIKNFTLERDLISAYANAAIRVIEELERNWFSDRMGGDCFRIKIKAEVIPEENSMKSVESSLIIRDDPTAPLNVQLWSNKTRYRRGEKIRIFLRGNKPFYARVLYRDADGNTLQLLPNPYRKDNYFNGGTIYEIPAGQDRFELEVTPPFGKENIVLYASTKPLGELETTPASGVFEVKTKPAEIGLVTRGVKIKATSADDPETQTAEFAEATADLVTSR